MHSVQACHTNFLRPAALISLRASTTALSGGILMALLSAPNAAMSAASCTAVAQVPTGYVSAFNCTGTNDRLSFGADIHVTVPGVGDVVQNGLGGPAAFRFTGTNGFLSIGNGAMVKSDTPGQPNDPAILLDNASNSKIAVKGGGLVNVTSPSFAANGIDLRNSPGANISVEQGGTIRANGGFAIIGDSNSTGVSVTNSGTIESTNAGGTRSAIQLNGAKITNEASGKIRSASSALQTIALNNGGTLTNHGLIENTNGQTAVVGDEGNATAETVITSGTIRSTGSTAIDLKAGDDTLELQPGYTITGNAIGGTGTDTLRFGGSGASTFALGLIGTGQQFQEFEDVKVTNGEWSFTGATKEDFTVEAGTVKGTGTFGNLTFTGGTFAPGNSIGTINVAGNLNLGAGSTFEAEVNASGQSDLVAVTGTTTINTGATLAIKGEAGTYPNASPTYTILTSTGGVTGTFGTVTDDLPDLDFAVEYRSNDVRLSYTTIATSAAPALLSPKEVLSASISGAGVADTLFRTSVVGTLGAGSEGSQRLSFKNLPDGLSLTSKNANARHWTVWTAAVGQKVNVGASGGLLAWNSSIGGGVIGVDIAPDIALPVIATVAAGYTNTSTTVGTSNSDVATTHLGLSASLQSGAWTFDGGLTYGRQSYTNTRRIPVGAAVRTAMGRTTGASVGLNFNSYLDLASLRGSSGGGLSFGPTFGLDWSRITQAAYSETGAGVLNLNVAGSTTTQAVARLGMAGSVKKKIGGARMTFDGMLAFERNFGDRASTTIATLPVTGQQFSVTSAPVALNRAVVGLGVSMELGTITTAYVSYEGRLDSGSSSDHLAAFGITMKF